MTLAWRIVEVGDATGSEASEDVRIIRLPRLIVTSANHRIRERVENPRSNFSPALVKVAGILVEEGWQDRASNERTCESVGIRCAEALCIPARPLAISGECIRSLFNSRKRCYSHEGEGI